MGADGHVQIWRDDKVREAFPDCDKLFGHLPTHCTDMLDGVKYHHCYWRDNLWVVWWDKDDWYSGDLAPEDAARLTEFVHWLKDNETSWEVWT